MEKARHSKIRVGQNSFSITVRHCENMGRSRLLKTLHIPKSGEVAGAEQV